jgi:Meckel syndrome type 1 protein
VVKVAVLKEQARELERQGDTDHALAIYQHILTHLEGTPAIKGQLPLYVKVGDLQYKQGDTEAAVAMYERAAGLYAELGSASSVIALCLKVLRVAPRHTSVYLRYARQLLEHGHVGAAREVLADFAERADLTKPLEALRGLEGRPEGEVRPVLERMLAGVRKPEEAPAGAEQSPGAPADPRKPALRESETPSVSRPAPVPEGATQAPAAAPAPPPAPTPATPTPATPRRAVLAPSWEGPSPLSLTDAPTERIAAFEAPSVPGGEPQAKQVESPEPEPEPPTRAAGTVRPPDHSASSRRPFEGFVREAERRRSSHRALVFALFGVVLVVAAVVLSLLGVIPVDVRRFVPGLFGVQDRSGAGGDAPATPPVADTTARAGVAPGDTLVAGPDTAVGDTAAPRVARPPVADSVAAAPPPAAPAVPRDTAVRPAAEPAGGPAAVTAALLGEARVARPIIFVEGLPVDSIAEFSSGEVTGVRVIQRLASGERVVLRAVPLSPAFADSAATGAPVVDPLRGDMAFGRVVFSGWWVTATARVDSLTLVELLRRLTRVQPTSGTP